MNKIIKIITGKDIVLYMPHRQTNPIVDNKQNRKKFIFIKWGWPFKLLYLKGKFRFGRTLLYIALSVLKPKYILSVNWITEKEKIFYLWCKRYRPSQFIVVQHGSYVGGVVTDVAHRYTHCDVFLTWGPYFTKLFQNYNAQKKVEVISFGNPVYNSINRESFSTFHGFTEKILLAPSAIKEKSLGFWYDLINKLNTLGLQVVLKTHNKQGKERYSNGELKYPEINNIQKVSESIGSLLLRKEYDIVISDKSTALLDAIFFNSRVLYFAPEGDMDAFINNRYSKYLKNLFFYYNGFKHKNDLYNLINIDAQEKLLDSMYFEGDNVLSYKIFNV